MADEKTTEGGDGGGAADYSRRLQDRLDRLLADPAAKPRDIGSLMRTLLGARKLDLMERQIALAERRLTGGGAGFDLAELVEEAEKRARKRKRKRKTDGPAGGMPR